MVFLHDPRRLLGKLDWLLVHTMIVQVVVEFYSFVFSALELRKAQMV